MPLLHRILQKQELKLSLAALCLRHKHDFVQQYQLVWFN